MANRGRPRTFSREKALKIAMELFWALGYQGTTLAELQKAMGGITAPSFYAAFGSKEALFRESVQEYMDTVGAPIVRALMEGSTARASVHGLLRAAAASVSLKGRPRGCLITLGDMNCTPEHENVQELLRGHRAQRGKVIRQRLERGVAEGDVPRGADVGTMASFYVTIGDGLALQARDGASRKMLEAIVDSAMMAWDGLASRGGSIRRSLRVASS